MARTVFSNDEIPHLWAHKTQEHARNGGETLWFRGDTLFSYRQPIARHVTSADGSRVGVLMIEHGFSVTTASHKSKAHQAIPAGLPVFNVDSLDTYRAADPASQLEAYRTRLHKLAGEVKRARSNKSWKQDRLMELRGEATRFAEFFGLTFSLPESLEGLIADADALQAEHDAARVLREAERARQDAAQRIEDSAQFAQWLAGEPVLCPSSYSRVRTDTGDTTNFLRLAPGSTDVETSLGAVVPLAHVQRALPRVLSMVRTGHVFTRTDATPTYHLGHYTLDAINPDGSVRVGCHLFSRSEVERFALTLGIGSDLANA